MWHGVLLGARKQDAKAILVNLWPRVAAASTVAVRKWSFVAFIFGAGPCQMNETGV